MIKISSRLKAIADEILPGQTVADIGTDHAVIPIYLYERALSPQIILTDCSEGPLLKARLNLQKYGLDKSITDLRMGDGLSVLKPKEAATVVIAGMGGLLIIDILSKDIEKTKTFSRFILQPRTASIQLRSWLNRNGFSVTSEKLALEGKRICEIITVSLLGIKMDIEEFSDDMDLEIPRLLFSLRDPLLERFLDYKIEHTKEILFNLQSSTSTDSVIMSEALLCRINALKERKSQLCK